MKKSFLFFFFALTFNYLSQQTIRQDKLISRSIALSYSCPFGDVIIIIIITCRIIRIYLSKNKMMMMANIIIIIIIL